LILIFGDRRDPHVETVRRHLTNRRRTVSVFSRYDADARFTIGLVGDGNCFDVYFRCDGQTFHGSDVQAVWWRQKPFSLFHQENPSRTELDQFIGREWHAALDPLEELLPVARWLNKPAAQRRANSKTLQLGWASQAGFCVPRTAFTNDAKVASSLGNASRAGLVYKSLTSLITSDGKAIYTNDVSSIDLEQHDLEIGRAPGIFQELIPKLFERRVIFVGEHTFGFRIDSQRSDRTRIDWRYDQEADMFEADVVSGDLHEKIQQFRQTSALDFGAIDIVVDKTGADVFLECNPAGQWLWLEEKTGSPVSTAVAEWLGTETQSD
jgi:glutathione synthase/RimK-type ligase-like ATP-grasp enzyme